MLLTRHLNALKYVHMEHLLINLQRFAFYNVMAIHMVIVPQENVSVNALVIHHCLHTM
jgi:hypothetical protein